MQNNTKVLTFYEKAKKGVIIRLLGRLKCDKKRIIWKIRRM